MALSLRPLLLVFIALQGQCRLVPEGFSCSRDMPRHSGIYSTPSNPDSIKVDLINVFCGRIDDKGVVSGFHVRLGNVDPPSAMTEESRLLRVPFNQYDYGLYAKPEIYDVYSGFHITKCGISSIWPTVLGFEEIAWIITFLVDKCQ